MTVKTVSVAPRYVSFYVAGSLDVDVPIENRRAGIFGSRECLLVPALYWNVGDTAITMGPYSELPETPGNPDYDGMLATPERKVLLFDVEMPDILSMTVPETETRIRIWINHPTEPDQVVIGLG